MAILDHRMDDQSQQLQHLGANVLCQPQAVAVELQGVKCCRRVSHDCPAQRGLLIKLWLGALLFSLMLQPSLVLSPLAILT